jgi:hypothetical protein
MLKLRSVFWFPNVYSLFFFCGVVWCDTILFRTFISLKLKHMKKTELKPNQMIYGNKGNVWSNTAHIYESGKGNLCGTPALATNWARIEGVETIGCPECLAKYQSTNPPSYGDESPEEYARVLQEVGLN